MHDLCFRNLIWLSHCSLKETSIFFENFMMGSQIISNLGHTSKDAENAVRKDFLSWNNNKKKSPGMSLNIQSLMLETNQSLKCLLLFFPQHSIYQMVRIWYRTQPNKVFSVLWFSCLAKDPALAVPKLIFWSTPEGRRLLSRTVLLWCGHLSPHSHLGKI